MSTKQRKRFPFFFCVQLFKHFSLVSINSTWTSIGLYFLQRCPDAYARKKQNWKAGRSCSKEDAFSPSLLFLLNGGLESAYRLGPSAHFPTVHVILFPTSPQCCCWGLSDVSENVNTEHYVSSITLHFTTTAQTALHASSTLEKDISIPIYSFVMLSKKLKIAEIGLLDVKVDESHTWGTVKRSKLFFKLFKNIFGFFHENIFCTAFLSRQA